MKVAIVGCGASAKNWASVHVDLSVGVNDCFKFGANPDYLVLVNSAHKFRPRPTNNQTDRLSVIRSGSYKKVFIHDFGASWKAYFPNAEKIALRSFIGSLSRKRVYSSKTSPFVAITLAYSLGATELILWGVDMLDHIHYSPGKAHFDSELRNYLKLFELLKANGVKVWIGSPDSVLKPYLPLYQKEV